MTPLKMLDDNEAEAKIAEYMNQSVRCGLITNNQAPYIILKNYNFARDSDGQISWNIDTNCSTMPTSSCS